MSLQAIKYDPSAKTLSIIDQLALPHVTRYLPITTVQDTYDAIKNMNVRGAPAIAIVGALGLTVDLYHNGSAWTKQDIVEKIDFLISSRPTAVNLSQALNQYKAKLAEATVATTAQFHSIIIPAAEKMLDDDVSDNRNIGRNGAAWILKDVPAGQKVSVMTICNTGSLATAGYGTALGIIRALHEQGRLEMAYCLETRPYNQGSRLTAYELVHDKIPGTLICDNMISALLRDHPEIKCAIVGADRVALNGDTANKIGTYQLAILSHHFGCKFIVAAPNTTIDKKTASGADIKIEARAASELGIVTGPVARAKDKSLTLYDVDIDVDHTYSVATAARGINVWNPAFDVTPSDLIDAIVTEKEVLEKTEGRFTV